MMASMPGMSNLSGQVFTIINQIPQDATVSTKVKWNKFRLEDCGKRDGLYDRSSGTMSYKANTWTAFINDWKKYKAPTFLDDCYYTLDDEMKDQYFTANVGDLLIFADIPDEAPTTIQEFIALCNKYKDAGGTITSAEVYINFKADGTPWRTNHIELVRG